MRCSWYGVRPLPEKEVDVPDVVVPEVMLEVVDDVEWVWDMGIGFGFEGFVVDLRGVVGGSAVGRIPRVVLLALLGFEPSEEPLNALCNGLGETGT